MVNTLMRGSIGLLACACALPLGAVPVTYTIHAVASGTLAGVPYAHKPLTIRMSADTATAQWDASHLIGRNPATTVTLTLDGVAIGAAEQPLGIATNCVGVGTSSRVGVDLMTTALPAFDLVVGGTVGTGACYLDSSVLITTAGTTLTSPAGIATSSGTLHIDAVDSLAYESLVHYAPSLKLRVIQNPYGSLSVTGGTFDGTTITGNGTDVVIDLGAQSAPAGSFLLLQYENTLTIGPTQAVTVRAGAPDQSVVLQPPLYGASLVSVQGTLATLAWNGARAPALRIYAAPLEVAAQGRIVAPAGLAVRFPVNGGTVNNHGTIDGGTRLDLNMTKVSGGGVYMGDVFDFSVPSGVNYPVAGRYYLANGLHVRPSSAGEVRVVPRNHAGLYGTKAILNLVVEGNAVLWMPSQWPPVPDLGPVFTMNDLAVFPGQARAPGVPDPDYGGGSMIVQATGSLRLENGGTRDFMFPGAIVLKAAGTLDLNGLDIVQGWTTSGKAFQGAFFEAPDIVSSAGPVSLYTNDLNWVNFSSTPHMPVFAFTLARDATGAASYREANGTAPHINAYSTLIDAAANDACWTCLVHYDAVDLTLP